jgi:hypothetical protein
MSKKTIVGLLMTAAVAAVTIAIVFRNDRIGELVLGRSDSNSRRVAQ